MKNRLNDIVVVPSGNDPLSACATPAETRIRIETSSRIGAWVIAKARPPEDAGASSSVDIMGGSTLQLRRNHCQSGTRETWSTSPGRQRRRDRSRKLGGPALGGGIDAAAPLRGVIQLGELSHVGGERGRQPRRMLLRRHARLARQAVLRELLRDPVIGGRDRGARPRPRPCRRRERIPLAAPA